MPVAVVLLRSNLHGFYATVMISFALDSTTGLPTETKNSLKNAFCDYTSVHGAALEEFKRLAPQIEGMKDLYKHMATVWSKRVFETFLTAFKTHIEWEAHDWEVMTVILKHLFALHITKATMPQITSVPVHLSEYWPKVSDAIGGSDDLALEERKVRLQEEFNLARKLFESRQ